jgi:hypothetical protein
MPDQPADRQLPLEFDRHVRSEYDRGQQLAILRHAELPVVTIREGRIVRKVKPRDLVAVLKVLDDHGPNCWPARTTIAKEARMCVNSVKRALTALTELSLVCIEKRPKRGGGFVNRYVIVWSELALRCVGDVLQRLRPKSPAPGERPPAPGERPPAPGERPPAPRGATKRQRSATRSADGGRDGAIDAFLRERSSQIFSRFATLAKLTRLDATAPRYHESAEWLAKVAVAWESSQICDADISQPLVDLTEGKARDTRAGYLWTCLETNLGASRFAELLASQPVPEELDAWLRELSSAGSIP